MLGVEGLGFGLEVWRVFDAIRLDSPMVVPLLGVVISGVISPLIWVINIVTLLITLLITTLNPKPYRTLKGTLNPL